MDVDPASHPFDPAPARRIAEAKIRGAHGGDREALEASIDRALAAAYGAWAAGWTWAASEPGGGGPVRGWCCARDSLLRADDAGPEASIERVVSAVAEWRLYLVELAATFGALHEETADLPIEQGVERAAARLLPAIVERTRAHDAWYATFTRVVAWYLEASGHDHSTSALVRAVVSGRFESWVAPDPETARTVCSTIGREAAFAAIASTSPPDALAAWRKVRERAWTRAPIERAREPVEIDGHERYIGTADGARDPVRAARMREALAACRASAARGERLTAERLTAWQSIVLGEPARARSTDAFAKGGRERYGTEELPTRFAQALAEANAEGTPVSVRAARAYLDTCYYHPFTDGNARAARLALDHVITRDGLALHAVEPLFVVARDATDEGGAWALSRLLEHLVGPRGGALKQAGRGAAGSGSLG